MGGGITLTPVFGKLKGLRVHPDTEAGRDFWVDYDTEKQNISIRAQENEVFIINLEAPK
jgi:hypothetical protein